MPICEQGKDSSQHHLCAEPVIDNDSVAQDLGRQCAGPSVDGSVPTKSFAAVSDLGDIADGNLHGSGLRFIYLFSGPSLHDGSLRDELVKLGAEVDLFDILIDTSLDLADDSVWTPIRSAIKNGGYHGGVFAPPCTTFSSARRVDADDSDSRSPLPVRGEFAPEIYGLKDIDPKDKEKVRIGTLLALRAAEAGKLFLELPSCPGTAWPWVIETPAQHPGVPSVFKLPEVSYLTSLDHVEIVHRVQCYHGALSPKPTEFLGTMRLVDVPDKCSHPFLGWIVPWSGKRLRQPHPPLRGTQRAIPVSQWNPSMLRRRMPGGEFLTSTAAAYPQGLNEALAAELVSMALKARSAQLPQSGLIPSGSRPSTRVGSSCRGPGLLAPCLRDPFVGSWKNSLISEGVHKRWFLDRARLHLADLRVKRLALANGPAQPECENQDWGPGLSTGDHIVWTLPLRGVPEPTPKDVRKTEDNNCLAGMRNAHRAVARIPGWMVVGKKLRKVTEGFFSEFPGALSECLESISGDPDLRKGPKEVTLEAFREKLSRAFGNCSTLPVDAGDCDTKIRADLIGAIAAEANDPGIFAVDWLKTGAPAGVLHST